MIAPIIIGAVVILIAMYVMSKKTQPQKIMLNTSGLNEEIDSNTEGPPPSTGIDDNGLPRRPSSNGNKSSGAESSGAESTGAESNSDESISDELTDDKSSDGESTGIPSNGAELTGMDTEHLESTELKPEESQDPPTLVEPQTPVEQPSDPQHRGDGTPLEGMLNQDDAETGVAPKPEATPKDEQKAKQELEAVPKPEPAQDEDQEQSSLDYLQYLLLMTYIYFFKAMIDQSSHLETYKKIKDKFNEELEKIKKLSLSLKINVYHSDDKLFPEGLPVPVSKVPEFDRIPKMCPTKVSQELQTETNQNKLVTLLFQIAPNY